MSQPPWLLRYGIAVLALGVVLLLKLLLEPLIAGQTPFLLLSGAVVVAAWFGGFGSGLLATVLGAVTADYFFLPPVGFTGWDEAFLPLLLFTLQGLLISSLIAALRSGRLRFDASWLLRYGIAVLALGVVLLLKLLLEPLIEEQTPFLLLSGAVVVAAWFGGFGSGLLAAVLGAVAADYFFLPPVGSMGWGGTFFPLLLFTLQGLLISSLVAALRSARQRADTTVLETEKRLRESEELYRSVVEQAAENIFLVDLETKRIVRANAALHRSLGYSPEELRHLTLYDIVAQDRDHDRESVDRNVERTIRDRHRFIGERLYRRKDGSLLDVEVGASVISYGGKEILCVVAHDVTERKKTEKTNARLYEELAERERELHDLVGRIIDSQEEERRRVAYEVHDGFTQMAAGAYRRLALFAEHRPPEDAQDRQELEATVALVRQTVGEARRIIANLRPTALDDFGLATAIRMQVDELRSEGFDATYKETLGGERLAATVETALFRLAQEALSNVRKHAETDRVRVTLERRDDGMVRLEVKDWGRGFDTTKVGQRSSPGERVGLSSMRERISLLGGSFDIRSEPGAGTVVVAEVSLPATGRWGEADEG